MPDAAPEVSRSDEIRAKLNKLLSEKPAYPAAALVDRYLLPYLDAKFEELDEYLAYVDEQLGEDADEGLVDQAYKVILLLSQLLDATFVRAGFLADGGLTESAPIELKQGFQAAQEQVSAWMRSKAEYEAGIEDDEEDDEDDEGEDGEGEDDDLDEEDTAAAPVQPVPTAAPVQGGAP